MEVLIPLLSRQESSSEFLDAALKGAKKAILLLVIDKDANHKDYGFGTSQISQGSALMAEVGAGVGKRHKACTELIEWGKPHVKIINIAKLRSVGKVVLRSHESAEFGEISKALREAKVKTRVI